MRTLSILALAAATSAFVIPDQQTLDALSLEVPESSSPHSFWDNVPDPEHFWDEVEDRFKAATKCAKHKFGDAVDYALDTAVEYGEKFENAVDTAAEYGEKFEDAFAGEAWLESADYDLDLIDHPPPHRGPPHHGPPHRGPPHRKPRHPPHHGPSNLTVYELIAKSKYTTKLAKAIDEFPDLVKLLNGTKANYTVFAPTDRAFEKIPEKAPKPPKAFLKKLLTYHVSPDFYPAGRVLGSRTIPTALEAEYIGKVPQRLSTQIGFHGLTINYYARVVAVNIFGSNGVIHGLDSILLPPPKAATILTALPGEFSTLELGLVKTGLFEAVNDTSTHAGGTLFAPSNYAFKRLGPRINAFLFSKYGEKYLKALLKYHVVANITLYSDAIYKESSVEAPPHHGPPKGFFHIDLPTTLEGKSLSIDIARYGRFITMKINGFSRVAVLDGIAADGVLHVVPNVLIPPKVPGGPGVVSDDMDLEELTERLAPYLEGDDAEDEEYVEEL